MLGKSRNIILSSLQRLLRPIAAFALARGIKLRDVVELLKKAFIDAAIRELDQRGTEPSVSKISAMTGLQRKDIVRLQDAPEEPPVFDLVTRIIGQWIHDRRFSAGGKPKKLFLEGKDGSFWTLVRSVSTDLNAYTVLFELERAGAATRDDSGWIQLNRSALSLDRDAAEGLRLLAADQDSLIRAVTENIFRTPTPPNHHIRTYFDNIPAEHEEEIRQWLYERGGEWHREASDFLSKFDRDVNQSHAGKAGRISATLASFSELRSVDAPRKPPAGKRRSKTK